MSRNMSIKRSTLILLPVHLFVQVGACIVSPDNVILGVGYNGFPRGCGDTELPWAKEVLAALGASVSPHILPLIIFSVLFVFFLIASYKPFPLLLSSLFIISSFLIVLHVETTRSTAFFLSFLRQAKHLNFQ
jgi:hypothetical protein